VNGHRLDAELATGTQDPQLRAMTEAMRPARSASIWFIIFMASMMHRTWPTVISSPISTKGFAPGEGEA